MNLTELTREQKQIGLALLSIRIGSALAFLYHGSGILFGAFDGPGLNGFAQHMHGSMLIAVLVGLAEFCGGLAMLTGVFARLGAACLLIVMLGAIFMVHLPHGFDASKQGMEYALTQALIALGILIAGAGPYTLVSLLHLAPRPTTPKTLPPHAPQA